MNSEKGAVKKWSSFLHRPFLWCCGFQGFCFSAFFVRAIGDMKQASLEGETRALRIANKVLPVYGDFLSL